MKPSRQKELETTVEAFRNLLPYLKDWNAWQREVMRLQRNILKLRKHRFHRLAKTLEDSLPVLRISLKKEKKEHAFTVNRLVARLDRGNTTRQSKR